jgi:zinc transport system substrate-binding protein
VNPHEEMSQLCDGKRTISEEKVMKKVMYLVAGTKSGLFVVAAFIVAIVIGHGTLASAQTIVASTSLTAAFARAAGVTDIKVLTPPDVKHPPEYELRPSDLAKLDGAAAVVFAGYERMVQRLAETSKGKSIAMIQVDTTTSPENVIAQARKIAAAIHTEKEEQTWEKTFQDKLSTLKTKLAPYAGKKAIVHLHAQPFVKWAGLAVVQVFMPGEQSVKAVTDAIAKQPDIVVDILHMPVARTIADNVHCRYAALINFPGVEKTATVDDIFEFNAEQIVKAFR